MNKFRKRIFLFYILLTIAMLALVGRLIYIQVFWSDELTAQAKAQQDKNIVIPAERGTIFDRNGDKLAFSMKTYSIWAQSSEITKQNETAGLIAETLGIEPQPILDKLIGSTKQFIKVVSNITKSEADLVRAKGIRGISIAEDTKRIYPYNMLASHLIGIVNSDGDGFLGLEFYYNEMLKGESGLYHVTTDVYGRQLPYGEDNLEAPINGKSLMLTIDDGIQFFVEDRIEEALVGHEALSVSAIVMDPKTGEIIAMSSKPDFDLNAPRTYQNDIDDATWNTMTDDERMAYWNEMWKNRVISNTYEPGSTFKALISAIALEENLLNLNTMFNCEGYKIVNGVKLQCHVYPQAHGLQTFEQAFANSCNPAFMEVGQLIGVDKMYEYFEKFNLFETTDVDLPAEANSISLAKEDVGPIELATMSYGHGINLTMMQMSRTISAIVNGGLLLQPQIVKSITDSDGNVVQSFEPNVVKQVISKETSDQVRTLLESSVLNGGGKRAYIEGIRIGGKSGTSQKFTENGYVDDVVVVSFVGIAPIDDPQYVVMVVVDEPKDQFLGGAVAAPIVKNILEDIFRYKNIALDVTLKEEVEVPNMVGLTLEEAIQKLDNIELAYSIEPIGVEDHTLPVTKQYPAAGTMVDSDSIVFVSVEE